MKVNMRGKTMRIYEDPWIKIRIKANKNPFGSLCRINKSFYLTQSECHIYPENVTFWEEKL